MVIPLLLVASILIGGITVLEACRANRLNSATTLHLVRNIEMERFVAGGYWVKKNSPDNGMSNTLKSDSSLQSPTR